MKYFVVCIVLYKTETSQEYYYDLKAVLKILGESRHFLITYKILLVRVYILQAQDFPGSNGYFLVTY